MYRILGADGKEYGPVSEAEIRNWIRDFRANAQTLAKRDDQTDWMPLSSFPEFLNEFQSSVPAGGSVPPPLPGMEPREDPEAFSAAVLQKDIVIDIFDTIGRGWEFYKANFWMVFAATLLVSIAASASGSIPYIGVVISLAVNGLLYAGLYWFDLRAIRGNKIDIADAFAGFTREPLQLILAGVVSSFIPLIVIVSSAIPLILAIYPAIQEMKTDPHPSPDQLWAAITVTGLACLGVGCLVAMLIYSFWMFTLPLVIDKRIPFWNAMELSRKVVSRCFGSALGLLIVSGLLSSLGILACCVGIYFTMPIPFMSIAVAYEDIFGSVSTAKSKSSF